MSSSSGNFDLFNDNAFHSPNGGAWTFLGGTGFGQSAMDYTVSLSTAPASSGVLGGSAGDTDTIDYSITVTNTSGELHYYTLFISTGIATPWSGGTLLSGLALGTVFELDGSSTGGTDFSNNGNLPLMQGLIDNVTALQVGTAPFGVPASPAGVNFFFANAGAGPESVVSSYGLILAFALEGDDQVVINGHFKVTYVPAPATLALLAIGVATGARRRRG
jgi:hypothetical protein